MSEQVQEADLNAPAYPSVAGQVMPDLNLAGVATSKTNLAGGNFADSIPPQNISVPPLKGGNDSIFSMGIDPGVNYFDLNLANNNSNVPSPASLAAGPASAGIVEPTFTGSDYGVPSNKSFDLQAPGIDALPAFAVDPYLPDLLDEGRPGGLDIMAASVTPLAPDPMNPDLSLYDRPAGLDMPGLLLVDPLHPDLQSPNLEQDVHMDDRPGDLAQGALSILHDDATCQQVPAGSYEELFMAQAGNNSRRERHLGMLGMGLEREEL